MRVLKKSEWPYQLKANQSKIDEIQTWCRTTLPYNDWYLIDGSTFCFRKLRDANMFALRWA